LDWLSNESYKRADDDGGRSTGTDFVWSWLLPAFALVFEQVCSSPGLASVVALNDPNSKIDTHCHDSCRENSAKPTSGEVNRERITLPRYFEAR
jgi:hypothetical protein